MPTEARLLGSFLELDLEAVASQSMRMLGSKRSSTAEAAHALKPLSHPPSPIAHKILKMSYACVYSSFNSFPGTLYRSRLHSGLSFFLHIDEKNEEEGLESLHAVINNLLKQIINSRSEIPMGQLH